MWMWDLSSYSSLFASLSVKLQSHGEMTCFDCVEASELHAECDFILLFLFNSLHKKQVYLFEEVAGKSENVEEGRISERRCDLPVFGQGMRRVGLSGGENRCC